MTREEKYLAYLNGEAVELPTPVTREEKFYAHACGMDVELPTPITRKEKYLAGLQGGGGGALDPLQNPARSADILNGKEVYDDQKNKVTGSLVVPVYVDGNEVDY